MKNPSHPNEGEPEISGNAQLPGRPSGLDRQEQYQRTREQAASGQEDRDREARIRRRAHEIWEAEGKPEGQADSHWSRAAEDLDREDADIRHEGVAGDKPGARPRGDADFVRDRN